MAAVIYGNAFPVDEATGKPVLPRETVDATLDGTPFAGCPAGNFKASHWDGVIIGAGIALAQEQEEQGPSFGLEPLTLVVIGSLGIALSVTAVYASIAYKEAALADERKTGTEANVMLSLMEKDPAVIAQLAPALRAQAEKPSSKPSGLDTGALLQQLLPVAVGLGVAAFIYNKIASGGGSLRAAA